MKSLALKLINIFLDYSISNNCCDLLRFLRHLALSIQTIKQNVIKYNSHSSTEDLTSYQTGNKYINTITCLYRLLNVFYNVKQQLLNILSARNLLFLNVHNAIKQIKPMNSHRKMTTSYQAEIVYM